MKLYLDVCCLNRPFDDQRQQRIREETSAIEKIVSAQHDFIGSSEIDAEIQATSDPERRRRLSERAPAAILRVVLDAEIVERALELQRFGFKRKDAQHLASAEAAGADWFLSTDDRLVRTGRRVAEWLHVQIENPATWWLRFGQPS